MKSIIGLFSFYVYFFFGQVGSFLLSILFRDRVGSDLAFSSHLSSVLLTIVVTALLWSPFLIGFLGFEVAYKRLFSFELTKWQLRVFGVTTGVLCYYFNFAVNEIEPIILANSIAVFLLAISFEVMRRMRK